MVYDIAMPIVEVTDNNQDELLPTLIGGKIISVDRNKCSGADFEHGANAVTLTLSDGRRLNFTSIGYDADACILTIESMSEELTNASH